MSARDRASARSPATAWNKKHHASEESQNRTLEKPIIPVSPSFILFVILYISHVFTKHMSPELEKLVSPPPQAEAWRFSWLLNETYKATLAKSGHVFPNNQWKGLQDEIPAHHPNVSIDIKESFVGAFFVQLGQHQFLYTEDDAIFTPYPDCCAEKKPHWHQSVHSTYGTFQSPS